MIKRRYIIVLATILTTYSIIASAEDAPRVRASIDKETIFIGDRIRYEINVRAAKGGMVEFPKSQDLKLGDFEVKDSGSRDLSAWYILTTYSVGKHTIPSIVVKYRKKSDKEWTAVNTRDFNVTVKSILPVGQNITDIKDIKGPFYFHEVKWPLMLLFVILICCFVLLIIYWRRRKLRVVAKLPHEIALEDLRIIQEIFTRGGDVKDYHIRISDCIRRYIENRFKLKAPEMTTEEFLSSVKDSDTLLFHQKNSLKEFLEACDLVKFAKYAPTRKEAEAVFLKARSFIEVTKT